MIYYIVAFLITLLCVYISQKTNKKMVKISFMILSAIPFIFISGFRGYNVGIDTKINYVPNYLIAVKYGDSMNFFEYFSQLYSVGFSLIVYVLSHFFSSPTALLLFCAILMQIFTFGAIYSQSKNPLLSVSIYFLSGSYLLAMNGMRGFLAFSIALFSLKYIKNRKLIKFIIVITIGGLIHPSVLPFLFLYPLYKFKIKKIHIVVIILFLPLLVLYGNDIIYEILKNTSFANYFSGKGMFVNPLYTMMVINSILLIVFYLNYNNNKENLEYNFYLKLQILSFVVSIMSLSLTQSYRVEQMVDFFQIITIPYNLKLIMENKKMKLLVKKSIYFGVIFLFGIYFSKTMIFDDSNQILNYQTIFSGESK